MKGIFRSLYWKLSAAFLLLLTLLGAAYMYLTLFASEMYFAETSQRLNAELARHIREEIQPFLEDGQPNQPALGGLFHNVMVVNPGVEVYLLDTLGNILAFDAPREKVKLKRISLQPIEEFLLNGGVRMELGDNPRDPANPKVFSAASVSMGGRRYGYIYVILRGEEYDSIAERILASHILTLAMRGLLLTILAAAVVGLVALAMVTRKLRGLTRTALAIKEGNYALRVHITSHDELDDLGRAFNAMADTLARQVEGLRRMDELRRELIANVSHDLRTPLASMQGYLETVLMKNDQLSPDERREYLEVIFNNTERLSRLVHELFELSKLEARQTQPHIELFSLAELANDLLQKFTPIATAKHVRLEIRAGDHLPLVDGDISMIERVLQNLLENAITYTPAEGTVTIQLEQRKNKVRVYVNDTGVGIPEADLPYVFDRFYQVRTKRETGGAGLGLSIVRKILEAHGETISVESSENNGSSFWFELPVAVIRKKVA